MRKHLRGWVSSDCGPGSCRRQLLSNEKYVARASSASRKVLGDGTFLRRLVGKVQIVFGKEGIYSYCRRADISKLLLAHGANPLLVDAFQCKSCLHYAAQFGWGNCCLVLLGDGTFLRGTQQLLRHAEMRGRDGAYKK